MSLLPGSRSARTRALAGLLIRWDAADWKAIRPLPDTGKMARRVRRFERGVMRVRSAATFVVAAGVSAA